RRIARTHRHPELGAKAGERAAQVALDVVVQRLERRDVEQPKPLARRGGEPVDAEQEGGEGLTGARGGLHEHVASGGDGRPAERLGGGRRLERPLEPGAGAGAEDAEWVHAWRLPRERMFVNPL